MSTLPHDLPLRILDGSPDAILICDRSGIVRYWNAASERVFGFRASEALGTSMNLIIPEPFRARHWTGWEDAMRTGITRYGEGQLLAVPALHKDGRRISIEFSIQFVKDTEGHTKWVVAVIRDVTKRYLREKVLRAQMHDPPSDWFVGPLAPTSASLTTNLRTPCGTNRADGVSPLKEQTTCLAPRGKRQTRALRTARKLTRSSRR